MGVRISILLLFDESLPEVCPPPEKEEDGWVSKIRSSQVSCQEWQKKKVPKQSVLASTTIGELLPSPKSSQIIDINPTNIASLNLVMGCYKVFFSLF